jgi:hypothetical protein
MIDEHFQYTNNYSKKLKNGKHIFMLYMIPFLYGTPSPNTLPFNNNTEFRATGYYYTYLFS